MTKLRAFMIDEAGATAVEYVIVASCISILIVAGASAIGSKLSALYYGRVVAGLS